VLNAERLDMAAIDERLKMQYEEKPWDGLGMDVRKPEIEHRQLANYYAWCRPNSVMGVRVKEQAYMKEERLVRARAICRFRTGCCTDLRAVAGRGTGIPWAERTCMRCSMNSVDDEHHLLLECECTEELRRQQEFADMLRHADGELRKLLLCDSRTVSRYIVRALKVVEGWPAVATQGHDNASQ
jgi:hypothetical protein